MRRGHGPPRGGGRDQRRRPAPLPQGCGRALAPGAGPVPGPPRGRRGRDAAPGVLPAGPVVGRRGARLPQRLTVISTESAFSAREGTSPSTCCRVAAISRSPASSWAALSASCG
ncbi:hypothetical protein ACFFX0_24460 [Citricoccus parietis]|uniref:Uncharacterized protein n=1 Tax=Citricoccus parietis TaxID=592307 RepID=A0ABV5G5F0_9MICC